MIVALDGVISTQVC